MFEKKKVCHVMIAFLLLIKFTGIRNNKSKDFRSFVLFLLDSANNTVYYK